MAAAHPDPTRLAAELAQCSSAGRPDWGLGDPFGSATTRSCELALSQAHPASDAAGWAAALGLVLARYDGVSAPVLAQLVTDSDADPEAPADPAETEAAGVALVPVPADGARTLGSVHKQVREAAAAGPAWHTEALRREITAAGGDLDDAARVGLVVADRNAATGLPGVRPAEYVPYQAPPFAVTVSVVRDMTRQRPYLRCDFDPRLLAPASAAQLLSHVRRVHESLLREPDTSADRLELLSAQELDRVHALGRHAEARPVVPRRIDAAIATIAAGTPDAVAVRFEDESIGYGELDRRADRRAHALRELGVADGDRVGVCLERSSELIVSLLAVLKAGATYVPMDPAYPSDRLSYTTTDAGLTTVVTDHEDFPGGESVRVVSPAELAALAPQSCDGPPRSTTGPDDAAYVIYTSGSTGRPKGVVIPHRNVLGLMAATTEDFGLGADDVWTLFHSSAFDFSVWEIWGALLTGATLVVVPYWASRSPEEFHQLLLRERVSVLSQTPSAFSQLVEVERDGAEPVPVRLVVFGGEALEPRMLLPWFDRHPESRCRVVNMYGITETTVHVTAQTVTRAEALTGDKSVGHALPGWWVRIADPEGRTLPIGVAGEIWVGGTGVATHYLNKPELTEERFRLDTRTGERMYRSGDRGRMLPDGRIEHLGRLDSQVKLRGFRIELDEIRAVLADDPQVSAAVVVLGRTDPDDPATAQLDAYVVLDGAGPEDTAAVRRRAAKFLPEYMVPSTVTVLERMPLTTNGKLDTRRLPKPAAAPVPATPATAPNASAATPGAAAGVAADGDAEPGGETFESVLLEVWQEVLGVPVGPDDNFFDHGGNSLLAMRVGAALRRRGGGFTVAMRELYLRPTIRQLAADRAE
ncbi:amino acid adenylation domain-containing protein [Streptomyces sp. P38-E01]|uniref:Amino acid adenylation domain-containing protein n=1 Tax=Streptomyces tardus TaxID=2780544 RepID=A0A949N7U0_9ACTN|nr:amino acid adenylation domain-containing protein [Streptomyces tardus]